VRRHYVPIVELNPKHRIRERVDNGAFHLDLFFFGHAFWGLICNAPGAPNVFAQRAKRAQFCRMRRKDAKG
jgi:hypothetical protein